MKRTARTSEGQSRQQEREDEVESDGLSADRDPVETLHGAAGNQAVAELYERGELRPKLAVSRPGDDAEREAERLAAEVTGSAGRDAAVTGDASPEIRRDTGGGRQTPGEGRPGAVTGGREERIEALQGGGRPLPDSTRSFFEERFDRDFGDVRVHTGPRADAAARSINAEAFTLGSDIAFAAGNYRPETSAGKRLLAHELTHVAQNDGGGAARTGTVRRQPNAAIPGPGFAGEDHPLHDKVYRGGVSHIGTKDGFVDVVEKAARQDSVETTDDLLRVLRLSSTGFEKRYLLCKDLEPYGGVLDLKHFLHSAAEVYSGQATEHMIEQSTGLSVDTPGTGAGTTISGFAMEVSQWAGSHRSGFSAEDIPSNELGKAFGQELLAIDPIPEDVPPILDNFIDALEPVAPDRFDELDPDVSEHTYSL